MDEPDETKSEKEISVPGKEKEEISRLNLLEILSKLADRLKEEIFILAVIFGILAVITVVFAREFPNSLAITILVIYSIAALCYIGLKTIDETKKIEDESSHTVSTHFTLSRPEAFQDPYEVLRKEPSLNVIRFSLGFKVKNLSEKFFLLKIYVKSTTQAVVFLLDSPTKRWKFAYGIIPFREETQISLDHLIEQEIPPNEEKEYVFHAWYRPLHAFNDFNFKRNILILYHLFGVDVGGKWRVDFHEERLEVPFKKEVRYTDD